MKDKDGFVIRCKHARWEVVTDNWDHDYICSADSHKPCVGDEGCKYYTPVEFSEIGEEI